MNPSDLISCDRNDVMNFSMWDKCDGCIFVWMSICAAFIHAEDGEYVELAGKIMWTGQLKRRLNDEVNRTGITRKSLSTDHPFLWFVSLSFSHFFKSFTISVDHYWKLRTVETNAPSSKRGNTLDELCRQVCSSIYLLVLQTFIFRATRGTKNIDF